MVTTADVLIIGGGIAGLALAHALSTHCTVVVAEAEGDLATHSSARSARQMQLSNGPQVIQDVTRQSINILRSWSSDGLDVLSPRALLWFAPEGFEHEIDLLALANGSLREIGTDEAQTLLPILRPGAARRIIVDDDAFEVDVPSLVDFYRAGALAGDGNILLNSPVRAARREGAGWLVDCGGTRVSAGTLVNAAGPWADQVAALCGAQQQGMTPFRRTVVAVTAQRQLRAEWPMISSVGEDFYMRAVAADEMLISPSDETPREPEDAQPQAADIETTVARMEHYTTLKATGVQRSWAGLRTFSPDRLPVVGADPALEGFAWFAGLGGYGIQTSAALARVIAADILSTDPSRPWSAVPQELSPARQFEGAATVDKESLYE